MWASSETVLGLPFGTRHARNLLDETARPGHLAEPDYVPIDEEHPLGRTRATRSRRCSARRWRASSPAGADGIPFIGLRFSAIRGARRVRGLPATWDDPHAGEWNVWGYVDARDVAAGLPARADGCRSAVPRSSSSRPPTRSGPVRTPSSWPSASRPFRSAGTGPRHAALDRQGAADARLRAGSLLARCRRRGRAASA